VPIQSQGYESPTKDLDVTRQFQSCNRCSQRPTSLT